MLVGKFASLLGRAGESSHAYDVSTETFLQPRLDRLAAELRLERDGRERGSDEEPASDTQSLDLVETRVVDRIGREQASSENQYRDMMNVYRDQLFNLDFDTKTSLIRSAADLGLKSIESATAKGVDRLNPARRDMGEAERHLLRFRAANGLDRPADYPRTAAERNWLWTVLAAILILETVANGMFFAQGNPLGLIGGWSQAILFATLNVVIGWAAGRIGTTLLVHRSRSLRTAGQVVLMLYVVATLSLNLLVAHFRAAFAVAPDAPSSVAMSTFLTTPLGVLDATSVAMVGLGIVFSLVAMADGRRMGDAYFGYDRPSRAFDDKRQAYLDDRQDLIDDLREAFEAAHARMNDAHDELGRRRSESRALHESIARATRGFEAHMEFLERLGSDLLGIYREANRKARSTPSPAHFNRPWSMARSSSPGYGDLRYSDEEVSRITTQAKTELDAQTDRLNQAFDLAMARLKSLDELEDRHGQPS
jgi:hypothetical protein